MSDHNHNYEVWRGRTVCIDCGSEKRYNESTETGARSYGMIHDSLCTQRYQPYENDLNCHDCNLIAAAYRRGYEDAVEDFRES